VGYFWAGGTKIRGFDFFATAGLIRIDELRNRTKELEVEEKQTI